MKEHRQPRVLFVGSKQLGLACLKSVHEMAGDSLTGVISFDDSADIRSALEDFKGYCASARLSFTVARNRADADHLIQEAQADFVLVCGWYWLLKTSTLESVRRAVLGIHGSLLPLYRGTSPIVWSIINGDRALGVTLFSITEGMDEGDIWGQLRVPIRPRDSVADVLTRLQHGTLMLLRKTFPKLLDGTAKPKAQDHAKATYCSARLPDDGEIEWSWPAERVYNFIRAQSDPYPGAFTWLNGRKLTVWRARPLSSRFFGHPGQVAKVGADGVVVVCGDMKAVVLELVENEEGRKPAHMAVNSVKTRFPRVALMALKHTGPSRGGGK